MRCRACANAPDGRAMTIRRTTSGSEVKGRRCPTTGVVPDRGHCSRRGSLRREVNQPARVRSRETDGPKKECATTSKAPRQLPSGRHAKRSATSEIATTCISSVTRTPAIFAPTSRRRPSGVTCSRRSTPEERSNPVAIESATRGRHHAQRQDAGAMKSMRCVPGVETRA